jgi:hypothetical protein
MRSLMTMPAVACLIAIGAAAPISAHASNLVISDGTFSSWAFGAYLNGSGGPTGSMTLDATQGNPAPGLNDTTYTATGGYAAPYGYDTGAPTSDVLNKAPFVLTVQFLSGPGATRIGQGVQLIVVQNGSVYQSHGYKNTGTSNKKWKTITLKGKLVGTSFNLISGSGPAAPDFSSGIPTEFGFSGQNYQSGRSVTCYYDNYNLTITLPK